MNHGSQHLSNGAVSPLRHTIHLGMKGGGHEEFRPHDPVQFLPEFGSELGVSIGHDGVGTP